MEQEKPPRVIVQLGAIKLRPSASLLSRMGRMDPQVKGLVEREEAIDSLAKLLTEAIETKQTKDGRIDMRDVAEHVLHHIGRHQR